MYRKGVTALILNKENKMLLVNLMSFEHHFFALPGGGSDTDESPEETVSREIQEELGMELKHFFIEKHAKEPIRFEFKAGPLVRNGITYTGQERLFFLIRFNEDDDKIKLNKEEVRKFVWSSFDDLEKYLLFDNQLEETVSQIKELCPEIMTTLVAKD